MPVRVFSEEEKIRIKEKLLSVGFPLLKEYGVIHMSVPKITEAAEIGTGTFYRFFESKEDYIFELIRYQRQQLLQIMIPKDVREGKRKLTQQEVRHFLELIADKNNSVYANMNLQDEANLLSRMQGGPDLEHEKQVSALFMDWIGVSIENLDFALLANMMKVLAITSQSKEILHEAGYERTIALLIDQIIKLIYG